MYGLLLLLLCPRARELLPTALAHKIPNPSSQSVPRSDNLSTGRGRPPRHLLPPRPMSPFGCFRARRRSLHVPLRSPIQISRRSSSEEMSSPTTAADQPIGQPIHTNEQQQQQHWRERRSSNQSSNVWTTSAAWGQRRDHNPQEEGQHFQAKTQTLLFLSLR